MGRSALCTIASFIIFVSFIPVDGLCQADKAETCLRGIMDKCKIVGMSVAVVKENKLVFTHSYGLKDMASNTPLTDNDIFRIASISKTFSATSIMQLVEAGKLSLNDDVSRLIGFKVRNPKFPEKIITLRMLLSHRSSINDNQGYFTLDVINPDKNADWAKSYNDYEPGRHISIATLISILQVPSLKRYQANVSTSMLNTIFWIRLDYMEGTVWIHWIRTGLFHFMSTMWIQISIFFQLAPMRHVVRK